MIFILSEMARYGDMASFPLKTHIFLLPFV